MTFAWNLAHSTVNRSMENGGSRGSGVLGLNAKMSGAETEPERRRGRQRQRERNGERQRERETERERQ